MSADVGGGRSSVEFTFVQVLRQNGNRNETSLKLKGIEPLCQTPPNENVKVIDNVRPAEVTDAPVLAEMDPFLSKTSRAAIW